MERYCELCELPESMCPHGRKIWNYEDERKQYETPLTFKALLEGTKDEETA